MILSVCSAHAEMVLTRTMGAGVPYCLLRTRGDGPTMRLSSQFSTMSAPHTRRWSHGLAFSQRVTFVCSAHAEMCILMLLYIVKGFGVLGWLVRGGDGLDPECGASFEFG